MPNAGYGPPYGSGTSSAAPVAGGGLLINKSTNESTGSRFIDPRTKDYVLDANGKALGMNDVAQLVHVAVSTDRGSSAVRNLGQELARIDRISPNFARRVSDTLVGCVQHLVDLGLIEVVDIFVDTVKYVPGRAYARLVWRDLTVNSSDADQTTPVGG